MNQDLQGSLLERGCNISLFFFEFICGQAANVKSHGGFKPGVGEIEIIFLNHAAWKFEIFSVADFSQAVDFSSPGIAQTEELGDFIIGFADGIVARLSENLVISEAIDQNQRGMSAGDDKGKMFSG